MSPRVDLRQCLLLRARQYYDSRGCILHWPSYQPDSHVKTRLIHTMVLIRIMAPRPQGLSFLGPRAKILFFRAAAPAKGHYNTYMWLGCYVGPLWRSMGQSSRNRFPYLTEQAHLFTFTSNPPPRPRRDGGDAEDQYFSNCISAASCIHVCTTVRQIVGNEQRRTSDQGGYTNAIRLFMPTT